MGVISSQVSLGRIFFWLGVVAIVAAPQPWTARAYAITTNLHIASKFEKQAAEHFPNLSIAEQTLLRAVEAGDAVVCFPGARAAEPRNPAKAGTSCSAIGTPQSDSYFFTQGYPG